MNGGTISENTDFSYGGGVFVSADLSVFTMNGGDISGNTVSFGSGGGVLVD
jgi:hypothetical protein